MRVKDYGRRSRKPRREGTAGPLLINRLNAQQIFKTTQNSLWSSLPIDLIKNGLKGPLLRLTENRLREFGGVGARYYICGVAMCTKWPPTPLYCSKNSLRGLEEKAFHCKRGGAKNLTSPPCTVRAHSALWVDRTAHVACDLQARSRPAW